MKRQNIFFGILTLGLLTFITSCNKSYLDVDPKGQTLEVNYYKTPAQAFEGLVAAYANMTMEDGWANKLGALNSASDECYTGGANIGDMSYYQTWNTYTLTEVSGPSDKFWNTDFQGIYRANLILEKLAAGVPDLSNDLKNRYMAEAKTLRAYYYFELIRLFKSIPLITKPLEQAEWFSVTQATREEVFAQIEKDLTEAIPVLPAALSSTEYGRMSKGAAMAILGKTILFQNNTARMAEAANWFNKVNTSGVYALQSKFGDIFDPANKFNSESILEITHSASMKVGDWGARIYGNMYVIMVGPRSYNPGTADAAHNYVAGWSFNPVIKAFAESMHSDPRFKYTIADVDSLVTNCGAQYTPGYQNTGYFIQKWAPLQKWKAASGTTELNFTNDFIEIRLADTYLLEAEASVRANGNAVTPRAQALLDLVRARVGLASKTATLDNIYEERRLELATEGHRWFDLVRTGNAASVLAFKGFKAGKHEFIPIPLSSINNTKMIQDPAYK